MKINALAKLLLIASSAVLFSACQLLDDFKEDKLVATDYAQYYLWLKNLPSDALLAEIEQQKARAQAGDVNADFNLILLYSLPDSPIHNAYNAKAKLNKHSEKLYKQLTASDLALITLLKDQLNQQLFLYQQLVEQEKYQRNMQLTLSQQQQKIIALQKQVAALQQQIKQLKTIEKTIQQRGK